MSLCYGSKWRRRYHSRIHCSYWIHLVNRGGFFEVNDTAYLLFKEIEVNLRGHITELLRPSTEVQNDHTNRKELLIISVVTNDKVKEQWTTLSADIEEEHDSLELLKSIVDLWINNTWIFNCRSVDGDI